MPTNHHKTVSAFTTTEALLAVSILAAVAAFISPGAIDAIRASTTQNLKQQGYLLAEEGLEAARSARDSSFENLAPGQYGADHSSGSWQLISGTETTDIFHRQIDITDVGTDLREITCTVSWSAGLLSGQVSLNSTLANWRTAPPPPAEPPTP